MRDMVQVRRSPGHMFRQGPDVKVGRSQFNMSRTYKTTFDASLLVPIFLQEVLPGDTFTCSLDGFCRIFSPLDAPIMDNIELETFFFFVPNRLVWANWENFNGAHDSAGAQDTDYTIPVLSSATTVVEGSPANYFGIPIGTDFTSVNVSALPFRGLRLIYNEWFRDQNLTDKVTENTGDGPDGSAFGATSTMLTSAKKHDYFTSCLPYLQKGDPVTVAIGTSADIAHGANDAALLSVYSTVNDDFELMGADTTQVHAEGIAGVEANKLYADLSTATGVSINALREAVAIQRLLERDARGGTRYVEQIKVQFGVTSPDFRHQRPEYLGGGKSYINVSPVANTSDTASKEQGELAGIGTGLIRGHAWAKSFTEHGYIIGIIRARGAITYFQGLDRHWSRSTRYDFYVPALAHLGEQSVLNKEIYVSNGANDDLVFGYQERWSEYRSALSKVTGKFSPDATSALSHWHVAEDFSSLPSLNTAFIEDATPMDRVTTIDTQPDFMIDVRFDVKAARPLPVYSVPSLIPRF